MQIGYAAMTGFRNLAPLSLPLSSGINVLMGENAQGKTNFLEAIHLAATGRSPRTRHDAQMVQFDTQEAHIRLQLTQQAETARIDVHLRRFGKKGIAVNGVPIRRLGDLLGTLRVVMFSPEDLFLVKGGPGERRRFVDFALSQLRRVYFFDLQSYTRILRQRNQLLRELQKKKSSGADTIAIWDAQLAQYADRLIESRRNFLEVLGELGAYEMQKLTGGRDTLTLSYRPSCEAGCLEERLQKNVARDILAGMTQLGPHKDDVLILLNGQEARLYGSQGQQRTVVLALRLAEMALVTEETGDAPVLLLDDVFSELDAGRQQGLLEGIGGRQAVITCTGMEDALGQALAGGRVFSVQNGHISEV